MQHWPKRRKTDCIWFGYENSSFIYTTVCIWVPPDALRVCSSNLRMFIAPLINAAMFKTVLSMYSCCKNQHKHGDRCLFKSGHPFMMVSETKLAAPPPTSEYARAPTGQARVLDAGNRWWMSGTVPCGTSINLNGLKIWFQSCSMWCPSCSTAWRQSCSTCKGEISRNLVPSGFEI